AQPEGAPADGNAGQSSNNGDDVTDVDFEEVKDDKK
ncbi:MAG: chaperone protein DnaK, partial [Sphingobacteriales bacterium]